MANQSYYEKLKDPRWQKKRLEIFERDEWACQRCGSKEKTLNIHHKIYLIGQQPWNYENELLITLCEDCHKDEEIRRDKILEILDVMLLNIFLIDEIEKIKNALRDSKLFNSCPNTALADKIVKLIKGKKHGR